MRTHNSKKIIALDFDGVMTFPYTIKSEEFAKRGHDIPSEKTEREIVINKLHVPEDIYEKVSYSTNIERILEIPPQKDAVEIAKLFLSDPKTDLYWITHRYDHELQSARDWLKKFSLPVDRILCSSRKEKSDLLIEIKADIFIDDTLDKIKMFFVDSGCKTLKDYRLKKCSFYLFRTITNKDLKIVGQVREFKDWQDIYHKF